MDNPKINDSYISELPGFYKKAYLEYEMGMANIDNWGSHQPLLIHLINTISNGDVIEFGMGDNSTPILHLLCEKLGRRLFSYDFDPEWYSKYKNYESEKHRIFLLNEHLFRSNVYKFDRYKYAIAFIDSHPPWTRQHAINTFKDISQYFIVHDSFWNQEGKITTLNNYDLSYFKYVYHFTRVRNGSSLFSNSQIPEEILKIFK